MMVEKVGQRMMTTAIGFGILNLLEAVIGRGIVWWIVLFGLVFGWLGWILGNESEE
jgi:hypothetical protein